ncbi:MAG: ribonuclease H-like domain-containing protein [Anaerolineaceae bacterium]|nr:ribonuclease H-like domain-containing protein [Anaerolineaceae bacterium]
MSSLMDRLKALGVSVGTSDISPNPQNANACAGLAEKLGGEEIETIYGPIIRIVKYFPPAFQHGNQKCDPPQTHDIFQAWASLSDAVNPNAYLFLDTETSGLSSGTGTFAFLVGIGMFTEQGFKLIQYFLESPANEPAMLAQLIKDMTDTSVFVTYNGKSFDIPLLRNRMILNRIDSPFEPYAHADLLHITRKIYKLLLPERNLGVVEKEILHLTRDEIEVPGWMVPEIYTDFLQNHDSEPIKRVLYHNEIDIVSLAALYQHINLLLESFTNREAENIPFAVKLSLIRFFLDFGNIEIARAVFDEMPIDDNLQEEYAKTALMIGIRLKQQNSIFDAAPYWQLAADNGNIFAYIELAKLYEHTHKEYKPALAYTMVAQTLCKTQLPTNYTFHEEINHRIQRLNRLIEEE